MLTESRSGTLHPLRRFEETASGPVCGPGMALAWSLEYFLLSLATSRTARRVLYVLARAGGFWLKYLDPYLVDRPGAVDSAAGFFFLGRKSPRPLSRREVLQTYRGAI